MVVACITQLMIPTAIPNSMVTIRPSGQVDDSAVMIDSLACFPLDLPGPLTTPRNARGTTEKQQQTTNFEGTWRRRPGDQIMARHPMPLFLCLVARLSFEFLGLFSITSIKMEITSVSISAISPIAIEVLANTGGDAPHVD